VFCKRQYHLRLQFHGIRELRLDAYTEFQTFAAPDTKVGCGPLAAITKLIASPIIVLNFSACFFGIFGFQRNNSMRIYLLLDRATGEEIEVDKATVERVTSIEISYIDWAIEMDGKFENAKWTILKRICCE
jgi:hypothetical protein